MPKIVLVTEASSNLGAATATALAETGNVAYAGVDPASRRRTVDLSAPDQRTAGNSARLRPVTLNMADQRSVANTVTGILAEAGRIDAVVHTVGPVPRGPIESFTPYQLARIYDEYVLSTQRVNRSVLPQMRQRQEGLLIWVVPLPRDDGNAPYLTLHSAALALTAHLAESYARELIGFGIETTIVAPDSPVPVTGPLLHTVHPDDTETLRSYEDRFPGLTHRVDLSLVEQTRERTEVAQTAEAIAAVVDSPKGTRPPRITPRQPGNGSGGGAS